MMKANKQIGFIYKNNESIDKILKDGDVVFERGFLREKTSTTLPITFGGVGKNLKDYRVYGNTVQKILPDGYTQVDYIESSGTQYIDTGFKPNQNTRMTAKTYIVSASNYNNIGGARNANNNQFHIIIANDRFDARYGTKDFNITDVPTGDKEFDFNKNNIYINDVLKKTFDVQTFQSSYNAYIFCVNNAGTPSQFAHYKLYNMKWYDNDVLVRDFIPCYRNSDNEVGLYDLVNDVFYTNQGTGSFTYGSVAPTPDAPIEIVSCGDRTKNLFDLNSWFTEVNAVQCTKELIYSGISITATTSDAYVGDAVKSSVGTIPSYRRAQLIPVEGNTEYTLSLSSSPKCYLSFAAADYTILNDDYYRITQSNSPINYTFTTPNNCAYILLRLGKEMLSGDTYSFTNLMLVKGTVVPYSYEPYGYKIPVNVRGKNLLDDKNITAKTRCTVENGIITTSTLSSAQTFYVNINDIVLKAGEELYTTFKVRLKSGTATKIQYGGRLYDGTTFATNEGVTPPYVSDEFAICSIKQTATHDIVANQMVFQAENANTANNMVYEIKDIIVSSNPIDTYEAYYNETTNIYLGSTQTVRQVKKYVFDGTENWNNTVASDIFGISRLFDNTPFIPQVTALCTEYTYNSRQSGYASGLSSGEFALQKVTSGDNNFFTPYFRNNNYTTVDQWKAYLQQQYASGTPVTVWYVLTTPTTGTVNEPLMKIGNYTDTVSMEQAGIEIPTIDGNNTLNIETEITPSQVYIKYKSNN